jgi:hypothetical protein
MMLATKLGDMIDVQDLMRSVNRNNHGSQLFLRSFVPAPNDDDSSIVLPLSRVEVLVCDGLPLKGSAIVVLPLDYLYLLFAGLAEQGVLCCR